VAFGPGGIIAAGYLRGGARVGGGVVLLNAKGGRLRPNPVEVKDGGVWSVAFGPEGTIAAGYSRGGGGGVMLLDAQGERLRADPIEVKEGGVRSVAFGPGGTIAAGYSGGGGGGVVLLDAQGEQLVDPIQVTEGGVTSVAFGPGGTIAAGYPRGLVDGGVVLLDGDPASWRAKAAQVVNRNLTWGEWKQFFSDKDTYCRTIRSFPWPHDLPEAQRKQAEASEKEHPVMKDAS
jgi:hypothetical protein